MRKTIVGLILLTSTSVIHAEEFTPLAVWANEAIVATYTYRYNDFLARQKEIAKYFTAAGWTAYSTALNAAKLPDVVKTHSYQVNAVAALPPEIKALSANQWQAKMPVLVVFKNPQYLQKQEIEVTLVFTQVPSGQGVRGLAIQSFQAKAIKPAYKCQASGDLNLSL